MNYHDETFLENTYFSVLRTIEYPSGVLDHSHPPYELYPKLVWVLTPGVRILSERQRMCNSGLNVCM